MTDIKKMAIGLIQDHSCQYLKFNNTADEIQAMAIEFFEAGAEAYKKSLLEVGVQGATKIYAPHINYKGIYGLRDLSKVTDKPYSQDVEQTVFIEALPALARISELEEKHRVEYERCNALIDANVQLKQQIELLKKASVR